MGSGQDLTLLPFVHTTNRYHLPIDLQKVTRIQKDSLAHVGDLFHAIDYDADENTPVYAALHGVVISVKDDSDKGGSDPTLENEGNYIEILHPHGEISEYEHLQKGSARVKIGDRVRAGDHIANVGNTGWTECPHLHFMVYPKGEEYKTREVLFYKPLPPDFRDRLRYKRWWANVLVLLHRRQIKAVCCESFRKEGKVACKGCATLYDRNSPSPVYRFLARVGKHRPSSLEVTQKDEKSHV